MTRLLRGSYNHLRLQRLNVSYVSNIVGILLDDVDLAAGNETTDLGRSNIVGHVSSIILQLLEILSGL